MGPTLFISAMHSPVALKLFSFFHCLQPPLLLPGLRRSPLTMRFGQLLALFPIRSYLVVVVHSLPVAVRSLSPWWLARYSPSPARHGLLTTRRHTSWSVVMERRKRSNAVDCVYVVHHPSGMAYALVGALQLR